MVTNFHFKNFFVVCLQYSCSLEHLAILQLTSCGWINVLYGVCVQEDSEKTGKVTSAGMYFLHFQVYRMDSTVNAVRKLDLPFFS